MSDLQISTADPAAARVRPLLAALEDYLAGLYPKASRQGHSIEDLQSPNVVFLVAEQDGEVVGCGALRSAGDFAEITRMYVVPQVRHQGVGRRLLAHLEGVATAAGHTRLRLESGPAQPEALALYEGAGFGRIAPFAPYAADPLSLFLEKAIPSFEASLGRAGSFP